MTSRHCDCRNVPQTTLLAGGFLNQDPLCPARGFGLAR
jgi:hypothetical protein